MASKFFTRLLGKDRSQTKLQRGVRRARQSAGRGVDLRIESLEDRRMLAAGDLDTTFNPAGTLPAGTLLSSGQGIVISDFGGATAETEAFAVVQLDDGKIAVAGHFQINGATFNRQFAIARYNVDGSLDTTFSAGDADGIDGLKLVDVFPGQEDIAFDLAVDSQNRIVAVGRVGNGLDVGVVRLLADGSLDTSFDGDGIVVTSSDTAQWFPQAVAIDANDSIVVAGWTSPFVGDDDFLVLRYTDTGALDSSFDGDGIATIGFNPGKDDLAFDVAIQSDGKIVVGGTGQIVTSTSRDFAVARLNADGSPDTTFGTITANPMVRDGKVMSAVSTATDTIDSIAIDQAGRIVVAGLSSGTGGGFAIVARYNSIGDLDTTFNSSFLIPGTVRINIDNLTNTAESALGLAIQPDGNYVTAGRFVTTSGDNQLLLTRVTPVGVLDTSFGASGPTPGGVRTNVFGGTINERFSDVIVQSDGKILAVGQMQTDLVLARYESGLVNQTIAGAPDVDEGATYTLSLSASDPTITNWTIDWGDGIEFVTGNPSSATHVYADGDAVYTISATVTNSLGTTPIANTVNVVVHNVAPALAISGAASVDEGAVYTLNLSSSDPGDDTITSWTIDWGDSSEVVSGNPASVTHTYADGAATYTISATATDEDGTFSSNSLVVTVENVAPTADAGGPYTTFIDKPITLSGSGSDVPADVLSFEWFLGDESTGILFSTDASATFDPTALGIVATSTLTVTLRVTDDDGDFALATSTVSVLGPGTWLVDGTLHIIGTDQNDIVAISRQSSNLKVVATFQNSDPQWFSLASVSTIDVRVWGGEDVVVLTNNLTLPTTIDGGSGNDVLTAGGGDTVIYGGAGNDILAGGPGNNVLIGGGGQDVISGGSGRDLIIGGYDSDVLGGGSGEDILIGGWTIYDSNTATNRSAIDSIMSIWTSSSSFNDRVATLISTGGLLEANETVFDDDAGDLLLGGGGRDLLFADTNLWDGAIDLVAFNWLQDALVAVN